MVVMEEGESQKVEGEVVKKSNLFGILAVVSLFLVFVFPAFLLFAFSLSAGVTNWVGFIFSILALVLSIIQIKKNKNIFAIIVLVLSILVFLFILFILIMPFIWKNFIIPDVEGRLQNNYP
jgi:cytochrome bd-type quinol oxidase subunit 2